MRVFSRVLIALVGLAALTSCTSEEITTWLAWNDEDPAAAQAFANSAEVQASLAPAAAARGGCDGIYDEFIRQGASDGVAQRFAYRIAPRESGCSPQFVHDSDDWSHSRLGLNGLTANLRAGWMSWCGADVRSDTADLATDVRCALAAHARLGFSPWGG